MSRPAALLVVAAVHGAALAALWQAQQASAPAAAPRDVALKLLPAAASPVSGAPRLRAAPPALTAPRLAWVAPPGFDEQPEARPLTAEPLVAPAPALPLPPSPAEPAGELPLQSARRAACAPAPHPPALRERGIEGVVRLRVWVDELGRAGQVLLAASSGWRLFDDAAMAQARRCPFHPAQRGSQAVGSWVEFPVRFALETASNG